MSNKLAEKWAEEYLQSDTFEKEKFRVESEFKDFIVFGKSSSFNNEEFLEHDCIVKTEVLSVEEIIERFSGVLSETDIENIKRLRDDRNNPTCL